MLGHRADTWELILEVILKDYLNFHFNASMLPGT